ncbi:MAG: sugar nucleotide-binding protein [Clostridia bacterium]|nr:sugar nucleotide-binding protein [Clostridia bacterium]
MKKILITGTSGFVGGKAKKYFSGKYDVYTPSHSEMDITDFASVERAVNWFNPDVIIHCAAMADVSQCSREPELSWKRNVDGSINVARAALSVGAKCLLCSSDQVYVAEDNLYAKEKMTAEEECLKINPDCVFMRLSWMYDPRPEKNSKHFDFFTYFLPKLTSDEEIRFAVNEKRGLTDIYEVVGNMEKAINIPGGIYDFGSPNDKNMHETAVAIFSGLGLDTGRVIANTEEFKDAPRDMTMNLTKLNNLGIFFSDTTEALVRNFAKALDR